MQLSLNTWTPASVLVLMGGVLVMGITGWYGYHMVAPPAWIQDVLIAITGGGLFGIGHTAGANSVIQGSNTASSNTAAAVKEVTNGTSGTLHS